MNMIRQIVEWYRGSNKPAEGFSAEGARLSGAKPFRCSRAFPGIVEEVKKQTKKEKDIYFHELSRAYNKSLRDGEYELAVILLMRMRMVFMAEAAINDARTVADTAKMIIEKTMMR